MQCTALYPLLSQQCHPACSVRPVHGPTERDVCCLASLNKPYTLNSCCARVNGLIHLLFNPLHLNTSKPINRHNQQLIQNTLYRCKDDETAECTTYLLQIQQCWPACSQRPMHTSSHTLMICVALSASTSSPPFLSSCCTGAISLI